MESEPVRRVSAARDDRRPPVLRVWQGLQAPRLSAAVKFRRAAKVSPGLSLCLIERNRRVQIALRPGSRAYPPSVFHFPAAAEWGIWFRPA